MLSTPKAKGELFLASSLCDGLEDNNIRQVTTLLLSKEADPNILIPSQGITPFHLVIGNDSETFAEEVTKLFLRHGGNPNVRSADGMTPVHVAAAWGRIGVLELLLASGGDPLLLDEDGRSPFHYAFDEAHYEAIAVLGKHCGEEVDEAIGPKYKIALDKVLINNGGIVAEYAVSEDTFMTACNVPAINVPRNQNNNDLLDNLNKPLPPSNTGNYVLDWCARHAKNDTTVSTTADETSNSIGEFVTIRRHRRCLPKKTVQKKEPEVDPAAKMELGELTIDQEKNLVSQIIDRLSLSLTVDSAIEESFFVQTRKEGENMPRISSPKNDEELFKCEFQRGEESQDVKHVPTTTKTVKKAPAVSKIKHKTPLRINLKNEPGSQRKTPGTATKISKPVTKMTPASSKKEKQTPGRYTPKLSTYSPDCSIVSKSPNLVLTPTNNRKRMTTPASARKERNTLGRYTPKLITYSPDCSIVSKSPNLVLTPSNDRKRITPLRNTASPKTAKKAPLIKMKTPTPGKINNVSRFIKQSDLRYQSPKLTPKSSPNRLRRSPKTLKKHKSPCTRTPNSVRQKPAKTTTPLNKTYRKDEFGTLDFSPDVEITDRLIDRKSLTKKIAIKLDDTMYDEGLESNYSELKKNRVQISGINTLSTTSKNSSIKQNDSRSNKPEVSKILAGHLVSFERSSYDTTDNKRWTSESRVNSKILAGNLCEMGSIGDTNLMSSISESACIGRQKNDKSRRACLPSGRPNSKDIDNSLLSTDGSSYFSDYYSRDITSDCSRPDNEAIKEEDRLDAPAERHKIDREILPKLEFHFQQNRSSIPQFTETHLEAGMTCGASANISSSAASSCYQSFVSVEEEYKYEDAEEGVILLERRFLVTPASIPIVKTDEPASSPSRRGSLDKENSIASSASSLPQSMAFMDSETLRRELTALGQPPGPITLTTHNVYLKRLWKLKKNPVPASPRIPTSIASQSTNFSREIESTLRRDDWTNDHNLSSYADLEEQIAREFDTPDPRRKWREGTTKSSFNYLLLDPRVTQNLPRRKEFMTRTERWTTFLKAVFYVGKGKRSRPYSHLYEANAVWNQGQRIAPSNKKISQILDIWRDGYGVVVLHVFQNTIPVEAYTREAAMIGALGLDNLKNCKSGDYYGVAATWSQSQKRMLGVYLLHQAMCIFLSEGERQIRPQHI